LEQSLFKRIEAILLFVRDIDGAANWYAKLFDVEVQYENPMYAFIKGPGIFIGFHPIDVKCPGGVGGTTVYWEVENIEKSIKVLQDKGAILYRGPIQTSLGDQAAMLTDPFGCTIGVHQKKN
jgi:predicted enzyme related to lactoylglutathione lyase